MKNKEISIVSGYMRTGTSMMMKAIDRGGIPAAFNPVRDHMNMTHGDDFYKPNGGGFYELIATEYRKMTFPLDYVGCVVKVLYPGLWRLRPYPSGYRVVFMVRDPAEIKASYEAFFERKAPLHVLRNLNRYRDIVEWWLDQLDNRKDILSIDVFQYKDVVQSPLECFVRLKDQGWNINPQMAAGVVDPDLYRHKQRERNGTS